MHIHTHELALYRSMKKSLPWPVNVWLKDYIKEKKKKRIDLIVLEEGQLVHLLLVVFAENDCFKNQSPARRSFKRFPAPFGVGHAH